MRFTITASNMNNPVFCSMPCVSFNLSLRSVILLSTRSNPRACSPLPPCPSSCREEENKMIQSAICGARMLEDQGYFVFTEEPSAVSLKPNEAVKLFRNGALKGLRVWTIPFTLSENTGVVINTILCFLWQSIKLLCFHFFSPATLLSHCAWGTLGGKELVKLRTSFPEISGLPVITVFTGGYASLPLGSGKEESKVFKSVGSEILENGI